YLAEVIQKKGGIIGGSRSEFKLLACQRSEQNWSAASDEAVQSDEASRFSPGTLLLVDLTANKQVQRVQEAGRPLVSILQNFSRLQEKFKNQEDEIEQWKQSLTYQSQELNRREMEMETRREQLQQLEEDFEQLEQQRQQFETTRDELLRQQAELERNRQELEGAWDQLQGQKQQVDERQSELQQASVLDDEQAQAIQELLGRLSSSHFSPELMQEQVNQASELANQHQAILSQHWQNLEQQRQAAHQTQDEIDRQSQDLDRRWQEWHQAQEALEQAKVEVKLQQTVLQTKQDYAQMLGLQIRHHDDLHQQLFRLAEGMDANISSVDVEALGKMPLDQLQALIQDFQRDFERSSSFVNGQEEELESKQTELEELKAKIEKSGEYDRIALESELADEKDAYQFLNQTLVGQRRSLKEKESVLRQHRSVLARRQGRSDPEAKEGNIDLSQVFTQIDSLRQQQADELQKIENELEQIRSRIQETQEMVKGRSSEQEAARGELKHLEETLKSQRVTAAELAGKVSLYQEMMQPIQDTVDGLRHQLEAMQGTIAQVNEAKNNQSGAIAEMQQIVANLTNNPEFAPT
ncbi:MAG: pilus motility taxis protein HmpF, partial [Phormidesmis sp. CAN_BIN44]|nr:pilus motility taxis protein HmpF [Phormidesmis sp. CAN_BIN44]